MWSRCFLLHLTKSSEFQVTIVIYISSIDIANINHNVTPRPHVDIRMTSKWHHKNSAMTSQSGTTATANPTESLTATTTVHIEMKPRLHYCDYCRVYNNHRQALFDMLILSPQGWYAVMRGPGRYTRTLCTRLIVPHCVLRNSYSPMPKGQVTWLAEIAILLGVSHSTSCLLEKTALHKLSSVRKINWLATRSFRTDHSTGFKQFLFIDKWKVCFIGD